MSPDSEDQRKKVGGKLYLPTSPCRWRALGGTFGVGQGAGMKGRESEAPFWISNISRLPTSYPEFAESNRRKHHEKGCFFPTTTDSAGDTTNGVPPLISARSTG